MAINQKATGPGRTQVVIQASEFKSLIESNINLHDDANLEASAVTIVTADSVINALDIDSDNDGIADSEASLQITPTTSRMAIKTKGTGAQRIQAGGDCDDLDAQLYAEIDLDGDGTPEIGTEISANESRNILKSFFETSDIPTESQFTVVTDDSGVVSSSTVDLDGDGNPESSLRTIVSVLTLYKEYARDVDDDGNPEASAKTTVTADAVQNYLDIDSDDDGIADSEASLKVTPTTSRLAIKTKGTGAQRIQAGGDCDDGDAQLYAEIDNDDDGNAEASANLAALLNGNVVIGSAIDSDDDGIPEASAKTIVSADSVRNYLDMDTDDDGVVDRSVSSSSDSSGARMAINRKGPVGGNHHSRTYMGVSDDTANVIVGIDTDDDGNQEKNIGLYVSNVSGQAAMECTSDLDDDGLADIVIIEACTIDSAYTETSFSYPNASAPTSVTGETKTAKQKKWLSSNFRLDLASRTAVDVSCDSATASSVWSADDFSGLPATSLTIQASTDPLVNPIEHSSGAHLTPGGSWTNSSDENLKENFQTIDGEELLNKIDELDINEWNYKSESDNVKHIGPTAQDFEKTFGLGSDGRSISTIDPSGIALAAIKALNEKSKRVDTLEKEVAELKLLVESMINNQATEK